VKKSFYQFETDPHPAAFDDVVGHDGGADRIGAGQGIWTTGRRPPP